MAGTPFKNASGEPYVQSVPAITYAHDWQQNGIDKTTAAVLQRVDQSLAGAVPGLTISSAYRPAAYNAQVGGAQSSQHIQGKAIDLDLSSFSPEQKQAVLNAVMAQPEIKGIGVYDKNLNTLHFDTRAGDRVAWGPDYTSASLGSVLNGYTQPMLTGWLNGKTAPAPVQTATASPPMPNLRQDARALQGANPFDTAPPAGSPPALAPPPTQLASSWLPKSLQQGGSGFVDDLGGGMSPLHQFSAAESSDVPAGPFGADALVRAAMAGDQAGVKKALGDITGAAVGAILSGKGSKDQITQQINDYLGGLATSAPGAVRQVQTAMATNPALLSILAPDQQAQVKAALAALPPQATGQVAMPNLRPPGGPSTPDPLVAGSTPDPLAPKMASFTAPSSPSGFGSGLDPTQLGTLQKLITGGGADSWMPGVARSLSNLVTAPGSQEAPPSPPQWPSLPGGDNLDMRTNPGTANASPVAYAPPAANAAGLAQLLGRGPQAPQAPSAPPAPDFGGPFWNPSSAMASQTSPTQMAGGQPSFSPPPFPSLASLNPTQMRGLEGATGQGSIQRPPLTSPGMPNFSLPPPGFDPNAYDPLADAGIYSKMLAPPKQVQIGRVPPMPTIRPPMPMQMPALPSPAQQVNLPDWGSTGVPTNPLQQAYYDTGQGDSYLNYPAFSFGF